MAVVVGTAFTALITAAVADLLTPLIAAIFGKHDFSQLTFTINNSQFRYGAFLNAVITFLSAAAAVFFFVVAPINRLLERRAQKDPDSKECPECTSAIPIRPAISTSFPIRADAATSTRHSAIVSALDRRTARSSLEPYRELDNWIIG